MKVATDAVDSMQGPSHGVRDVVCASEAFIEPDMSCSCREYSVGSTGVLTVEYLPTSMLVKDQVDVALVVYMLNSCSSVL